MEHYWQVVVFFGFFFGSQVKQKKQIFVMGWVKGQMERQNLREIPSGGFD